MGGLYILLEDGESCELDSELIRALISLSHYKNMSMRSEIFWLEK